MSAIQPDTTLLRYFTSNSVYKQVYCEQGLRTQHFFGILLGNSVYKCIVKQTLKKIADFLSNTIPIMPLLSDGLSGGLSHAPDGGLSGGLSHAPDYAQSYPYFSIIVLFQSYPSFVF